MARRDRPAQRKETGFEFVTPTGPLQVALTKILADRAEAQEHKYLSFAGTTFVRTAIGVAAFGGSVAALTAGAAGVISAVKANRAAPPPPPSPPNIICSQNFTGACNKNNVRPGP